MAPHSYNQMAPHSYNQMALHSYNQMAPQSYYHILIQPKKNPPSVGAAVSMGIPGGLSSTSIVSTPNMGFTGPSPNVTPPIPNGPFLAVGKPNTNYLSSSAIQTNKLWNIDEVIAQYQNYVNELNAGTLCQIFVREAILRKDVLAHCTISGNGGKTALRR